MSEMSCLKLGNDIEKAGGYYAHLTNTTVRSFGWENVTVNVRDRESKLPKTIVSNVSGVVQAGKYPYAKTSWKSLANCNRASCWLSWVRQVVERPHFSMYSPTVWLRNQQTYLSLFTSMEERLLSRLSKR